MKKFIAILICFVSAIFISTVRINAATPNYSTSITDTSSIEDDFKSMNIKLSGYECHIPDDWLDYLSEKNTFTLVDFQVSKLNEEEGRIYLYVYCPLKYVRSNNDYIECFWASFDIEGYEFESTWDHQNYNSKELAYDDVHGIFKLRCNKFKYSDSNKITITSIIGAMAIMEYQITCFPNMTKEIVFKESILPVVPTTPADKISKSSSIADDFRNMNMDIEDYYIPKKYNYSKWYVAAMSFVVGKDNKVQSYFYIYNPKQTAASTFEITYKVNNSVSTDYFGLLKSDATHGLYKVEGFTMEYKENMTSTISISNIISSGTNSSSEFEINVSLSKNSNTEVTIQSKFDSTIIIEEYKVVEIQVKKDDNFINNWEDFWTCSTTEMLVFFYNFNFPKHIKPDSIEYAAFQYDYKYYYEKIWLKSLDFTPDPELAQYNEKTLLESEKVFSKYNNDSKTLRVNKHSQELNFPTFYLGNRIKDKQFGSLDVSGELTSFDYDCSILLDSTYKSIEREYGFYKPLNRGIVNHINYTSLDNVEFIELHYKKDGVVYKCQVVNPPVDKDEFDHGVAETPKKDTTPEPSWWKKLLLWLGETIVHFFSPTTMLPEWGYMAVGIGVCILCLLMLPYLIKFLIVIIKIPFSLLK